jgi:hypothetical protein
MLTLENICKIMLTHVHKVVHLVVSTFSGFVHMKYIFSIAPEAKFREVAGVFFTRTLSVGVSDGLVFDTCWSFDTGHSRSPTRLTL